MTARLVFDAKDIVGESLIWSADDRALYWIDIVGSRIHRLDPETGDHRVWPTPELPTSIGLCQGGGFILGLRRRVVLWTPGGTFDTFAVPEPDMPGNRLNEGVVAPDGSFWVGTMQDNIASDGSPEPMTADTGALYRIRNDGTVDRLTEPDFGITNTMVWTDDGRFITADTVKNALYQFDIDTAGALVNRRLLLDSIGRGLPDGSTRDAAGLIYNCRVAGGGAIACIDPSGSLRDMIELPTASPTSCAFGGDDLDTLFVTSASFGLSADQRREKPQEGALFAVSLDTPGLPPSRFG